MIHVYPNKARTKFLTALRVCHGDMHRVRARLGIGWVVMFDYMRRLNIDLSVGEMYREAWRNRHRLPPRKVE